MKKKIRKNWNSVEEIKEEMEVVERFKKVR